MQVNANPESFQAQYERLVENWLAKFAQINKEVLKNLEVSVVDEKGEKQTLYGTNESGDKVCNISPEQIEQMESGELKPDIQVSQPQEETIVRSDQIKVFAQDEMGDSEMIYGKSGSRMIDRLNQERIEQLREASNAKVGDKTNGEPLKVKVGDEVVFEVDESGTVTVNSGNLPQVLGALDEPVQEQKQEQSPPALEDYYDDYDYGSYDFEAAQEDTLIELVSDLVENLPDPAESEPEHETQDEIEEFFEETETFEAVAPLEPQEEAVTPTPIAQELPQEPQKTGLDCIEESVGQLKDGTLKVVLGQAVGELKMEVSEQQPNPQLDQLMEARSQSAQDPNWWQRASSKVEEMVTAVRDTFVGGRAASTLKQFADKLDLQSGDSFSGAEYNLKRQGRDYTLTDKSGKELLKFKSSVLGIKVDNRLSGLDDRDFRKIEALRKDLARGSQPQGAFVSEAKAEATYLKRVSTITSALTQYAQLQGGAAKVEGRYSYDWQASNGSVMIKNKQGDVLLACGQGHMKSRMAEKDLAHFEEMLPNLGMQRQAQAIGQKKQMEMN